MSETQRKDSSEKQAWEHIAPVLLPPNWSLRLHLPASEEDNDPELASALDARGGEVYRGTREECARRAWDAFGITRKRYAELIAPGLVRKAAEEKWGQGYAVVYTARPGRHVFHAVDMSGSLELGAASMGNGPDICTAALATIQALGGGE